MLAELLNLRQTLIMGVLNVTPDSFSDGGQFYQTERAVRHALKMAEEGADIIDVGGESSRPGSDPVSADEEKKRVLPVIEALKPRLSIPMSVDTRRSSVARLALDLGVRIVNDITGLRDDRHMADLVAESEAFVIIMHMKGKPKTMQVEPHYDDLMGELISFFNERVDYALAKGIRGDRIILDPGIGFGKRVSDNFVILNCLERIVDLGYPVLVGPSRKSFIGLTLDLPPDKRLEGTAASVTASVLNGARIIRVHDVREMKRVVTIADAIRTEGAVA